MALLVIFINKIKEFDLAAVYELRKESSTEGYRFIGTLCEEWVSGTNRFNAPGEAVFVATDDGQVVGVCGLNSDPYVQDPRIGRVRRLYVSPAHRRGGVGRALLEAVITHARGHFRLLRVRTEEASEFFIAHGFQCIESEPDTTHVFHHIHSA
jgi:GNAT superfamily N-acetyltransferase